MFQGRGASNHLQETRYIEIIVPIEEKIDDKARIVGVMLTSVSTDSILSSYEYIKNRALLLEILAMVVIFGIAFL